MVYEEKIIYDREGRELVLRSAAPEDAQMLMRYMDRVMGETPFLMREPGELDITEEKERALIQAVRDSENELLLMALRDGEHVGNCALRALGPHRRYRHRCTVSIALYQNFCGQGIGRQMMTALLEVAKSIGFEQAELEVVSDNHAAIRLYRALGFETYGHFPDNMKYADGHYADADWMMKKL